MCNIGSAIIHFVCNTSTDKNISYSCVTNVRTLHIFVCIFNIRIFNGCEVRIENSITRVTVRHREACIKQINHYEFFFLYTLPSTVAFRLEYVLFFQFYAEITTFFQSRDVDVETFGGE